MYGEYMNYCRMPKVSKSYRCDIRCSVWSFSNQNKIFTSIYSINGLNKLRKHKSIFKVWWSVLKRFLNNQKKLMSIPTFLHKNILETGFNKKITIFNSPFTKQCLLIHETMEVLKKRRNNSEKQPCFGN